MNFPKPPRLARKLAVCTGALIAAAVSVAHAPTQAQQASPQQAPPQQASPQQASPQQEPAQRPAQQPEAESLGGTDIQQRDYMADERRPAPPETPRPEGSEEGVDVSRGAGVGSTLGYARRTVVELGGVVAFTHRSQTTDFRIAPSIGYFFIDGLELTLFPELHVVDVDGETDFTIAGTLEPSYHIALSGSELFAFGGIGIGLSYADDPGVDLFFRPRLGLDIMVGRSGILKPAFFLDVGANDGLEAGGMEAAFTVMW